MIPLHPTLADPLGPGYIAGWYASSNIKGRKDDCKITTKGRNVVKKYYNIVRMALADNVTLESMFGRKVFDEKYHGMGHSVISKDCSTARCRGCIGILLDTSTSARDPIFYRWHTNVNGIAQKFISKLPK